MGLMLEEAAAGKLRETPEGGRDDAWCRDFVCVFFLSTFCVPCLFIFFLCVCVCVLS